MSDAATASSRRPKREGYVSKSASSTAGGPRKPTSAAAQVGTPRHVTPRTARSRYVDGTAAVSTSAIASMVQEMTPKHHLLPASHFGPSATKGDRPKELSATTGLNKSPEVKRASPGRGGRVASPHHLAVPRDEAAHVVEVVRSVETAAALEVDAAVHSNQTVLDLMSERRSRADQLAKLYREEAQENDIEIAKTEEELRAVNAERKATLDRIRALELQSYQIRKGVASSRLRAEGRALPPGAAATNSARALNPLSSTAAGCHTSRSDYHSLNRRLDSAKTVTQSLRNEIARLEASIAERMAQRAALMTELDEIAPQLSRLEADELAVSGAARQSKEAVMTAGAMAAKFPYLEKRWKQLEETIALTRQDSEETQKLLMARIQEDDSILAKLRELADSRRGTASPVILPSLIRNLQDENERLQRSTKDVVDRAELVRQDLQRAADGLRQRLSSLEARIRTAEQPSAV